MTLCKSNWLVSKVILVFFKATVYLIRTITEKTHGMINQFRLAQVSTMFNNLSALFNTLNDAKHVQWHLQMAESMQELTFLKHREICKIYKNIKTT